MGSGLLEQLLIVNVEHDKATDRSALQGGGQLVAGAVQRGHVGIHQVDAVQRQLLGGIVDDLHPERGGFRPGDDHRKGALRLGVRRALGGVIAQLLRFMLDFGAQRIGYAGPVGQRLPYRNARGAKGIGKLLHGNPSHRNTTFHCSQTEYSME